MAILIHINDNNLLIQQGGSWERSQGYAWLNNEEVYFDLDTGNNAVLNCRLEPQQINSRYWQQCSQTALSPNDSGMRHSADLIWKHLSAIKEKYQLSEVSFVIPSHYQAANLSLLLGVAKAVGLQVRGLINKAVYCLQGQTLSVSKNVHIDVQLHQTVCSEVEMKSNVLTLGKVEVLHEVGLQMMQDALLRAIQERFIASDRFDPLHYAETEQQLFGQLNGLAEKIERTSKADIVIEFGGRKHGCSIDSKQWQDALNPFAETLKGIGQPDNAQRFIDFNDFKGLATSLPEFHIVSEKEQARVAPEEYETIEETDSLVYCTELAFSHNSMDQGDQRETAVSEAPIVQNAQTENHSLENGASHPATHLMQHGFAVPLANAHLEINQGQMTLSFQQESNIAAMITEKSLYVLSDKSRTQLEQNDRLGSDLAEGVVMVINVIGEEI